MDSIGEILKSKKKQKEIVTLLVEKLKTDASLFQDLLQHFENGTIPEKGHCMEAIEHITRENPSFVESHLEFVIQHINDDDDDAPRVKWKSGRIIGNVAKQFPKRVRKAVPLLLRNTEDKGIVVRWSAAFALTEIAKSNPDLREELGNKFRDLVEKETNNGVRKIYQKYLKDYHT